MTITSRAEPDVEPNGATARDDDDNDDCNNKPLFILKLILAMGGRVYRTIRFLPDLLYTVRPPPRDDCQ